MKYFLSTLVLTIAFATAASAQTGWGFQQHFVTAGSQTVGYPIATAIAPVGSYVGSVGATYVSNPDGSVSRVASVLYYTPLSPNPQPTETHYFIAGVCQGLRVPDGYRRIQTWRNIYGLDNPDTGGFDNTTEFCVMEIAPR